VSVDCLILIRPDENIENPAQRTLYEVGALTSISVYRDSEMQLLRS